MSDERADQYIAQAVEESLSYSRARVKEMHAQVERIKMAAERITRECDAFLAGKSYDDEPF